MASKKVSVLKFVGTISLGLLTGTSYTLSTLSIPSLLELTSASTAAKACRSLASSAATHLTTLSIVSGSSFLLAFIISPSGYRHPYLLYTSICCLSTRLTTNYVIPYIFGPSPSSSSASAQRRAAIAQARREKAAARRMEASYEVLGDPHSEEGASSVSGEEFADEEVNGEEVRSEVEFFSRDQLVQTAISGLGFMIAVLGIWGDGAHQGMVEQFLIELDL